ncbi:hypothetical protein T03_15086 [Trichinella britovi]|uniref:Uncharacterized protein n=2 Tax=Trichinella TaxID=6333 RepID=A0A0V1CXR8_TRIBR|nr:hypothetical protein T05_3455 [Trichinella murrelli]KRX81043.1 hypothetical protein T06_2997 [Trichinella sp. T6]KRY53970.1 hypothetical protein T03_15086 [Trichinella britovi]KRZ87206.1 hypothetical protein T08_6404 [Trichinella sp. T8]
MLSLKIWQNFCGLNRLHWLSFLITICLSLMITPCRSYSLNSITTTTPENEFPAQQYKIKEGEENDYARFYEKIEKAKQQLLVDTIRMLMSKPPPTPPPAYDIHSKIEITTRFLHSLEKLIPAITNLFAETLRSYRIYRREIIEMTRPIQDRTESIDEKSNLTDIIKLVAPILRQLWKLITDYRQF